MRKRYGLGILSALLMTACSTSLNLSHQPAPGQQGFRPAGPAAFRAYEAERKVVVSFEWQQKKDLVDIATRGLDLYGVDAQKHTARARVSPQEIEFLKARQIPFRVIFEKEMNASGLPPGYMTFEQMTQRLQALATQYPDLVTLEDIGDTWEKQQGKSPKHDIWAISIANKNSSQAKPTFLFTAGVHARELAPVELLMKMADHLTSQYGKDPLVTELLNTREVLLVPMVNVDGRVAVERGNTWQRKNTHGTGIDLNRNFDTYWNYEGLNVPESWKYGLKDPRSETYSGPHASSESETQAIEAIYKRKKIHANMDIHAYGDMFFWPVGYSEKPIPEAPVYQKAWNETFKKIGFDGGTSATLLYPTTGTTDDYGYKMGAFSLGMEVGNSFRPSFRETEQMWDKMRPHFLRLIQISGQTSSR